MVEGWATWYLRMDLDQTSFAEQYGFRVDVAFYTRSQWTFLQTANRSHCDKTIVSQTCSTRLGYQRDIFAKPLLRRDEDANDAGSIITRSVRTPINAEAVIFASRHADQRARMPQTFFCYQTQHQEERYKTKAWSFDAGNTRFRRYGARYYTAGRSTDVSWQLFVETTSFHWVTKICCGLRDTLVNLVFWMRPIKICGLLIPATHTHTHWTSSKRRFENESQTCTSVKNLVGIHVPMEMSTIRTMLRFTVFQLNYLSILVNTAVRIEFDRFF